MNFKNFIFLLFILLMRSSVWGFPPALEHLVHELPDYKQFHLPYQVEKIEGGLTNHNFKVTFPTQTYFVRLGCAHSPLLGLDPEREVFCTQAAATLGLAPGIALYLPTEKAMAFPFIAAKPFDKSPASYVRVLATLRKFHQSNIILPTSFDPYQVIQGYYQQVCQHRPDPIVSAASEIISVVDAIQEVIPTFKQVAPCHLDLFSLNFLDDGEKMWIVDWEYSAMADPLFDLATLVSSERLSIANLHKFLELYLEHPTEKDVAYFYLMCILADVRWWLWSLLQAELSPLPASYLDFADDAMDKLLEKVRHPNYHKSLRVLRSKKNVQSTIHSMHFPAT